MTLPKLPSKPVIPDKPVFTNPFAPKRTPISTSPSPPVDGPPPRPSILRAKSSYGPPIAGTVGGSAQRNKKINARAKPTPSDLEAPASRRSSLSNPTSAVSNRSSLSNLTPANTSRQAMPSASSSMAEPPRSRIGSNASAPSRMRADSLDPYNITRRTSARPEPPPADRYTTVPVAPTTRRLREAAAAAKASTTSVPLQSSASVPSLSSETSTDPNNAKRQSDPGPATGGRRRSSLSRPSLKLLAHISEKSERTPTLQTIKKPDLSEQGNITRKFTRRMVQFDEVVGGRRLSGEMGACVGEPHLIKGHACGLVDEERVIQMQMDDADVEKARATEKARFKKTRKAEKRCIVFGASLRTIPLCATVTILIGGRRQERLPTVVVHGIERLYAKGITSQDLFIPMPDEHSDEIISLIDYYSTGPHFGDEEDSPINNTETSTICHLLHYYIKSLPEPPLESSFFQALYDLCILPSIAFARMHKRAATYEEERSRIIICRYILRLMPKSHFCALTYLLAFFAQVVLFPENGMTPKRISAIMGPAMFAPRGALSYLQKENAFPDDEHLGMFRGVGGDQDEMADMAERHATEWLHGASEEMMLWMLSYWDHISEEIMVYDKDEEGIVEASMPGDLVGLDPHLSMMMSRMPSYPGFPGFPGFPGTLGAISAGPSMPPTVFTSPPIPAPDTIENQPLTPGTPGTAASVYSDASEEDEDRKAWREYLRDKHKAGVTPRYEPKRNPMEQAVPVSSKSKSGEDELQSPKSIYPAPLRPTLSSSSFGSAEYESDTSGETTAAGTEDDDEGYTERKVHQAQPRIEFKGDPIGILSAMSVDVCDSGTPKVEEPLSIVIRVVNGGDDMQDDDEEFVPPGVAAKEEAPQPQEESPAPQVDAQAAMIARLESLVSQQASRIAHLESKLSEVTKSSFARKSDDGSRVKWLEDEVTRLVNKLDGLHKILAQ